MELPSAKSKKNLDSLRTVGIDERRRGQGCQLRKDELSRLLKHFMFICGDDSPPTPQTHPTYPCENKDELRVQIPLCSDGSLQLALPSSHRCCRLFSFYPLLKIKMPLLSPRGHFAATSAAVKTARNKSR